MAENLEKPERKDLARWRLKLETGAWPGLPIEYSLRLLNFTDTILDRLDDVSRDMATVASLLEGLADLDKESWERHQQPQL